MMHIGYARRLAVGVASTLAGVIIATMAGASRIHAQPGKVQPSAHASEVSLDSLLNTRVSAAAKYLQTTAEAAASITIVSAEDIRSQGYSNLQEVLESVPGMYVSNDRNYPYLGTRGFSRPSDYNNRILVLVDGHTLNEQVWGSAPVGSDLPINLDAVERVEVVRGPGSALYGSSAMFAVINIVTKTGTQTSGGVVSGRVGSGLQRQAAANIGYDLGNRKSFAISALTSGSNGNTLYYPEYRSASNTKGAVRRMDWEYGTSVIGTLITGDVTTRAGFRSRAKGIPTGAYQISIGDRRAETLDESVWGEVAARHEFAPSLRSSMRVYADRAVYHGHFPYDSGPSYAERAISADFGTEGMLIWDATSRNRLTVGTELRRVFTAQYKTRGLDGVLLGDDAPFSLGSVYAQDELQLLTGLKLVGGLRFDRKLSRWQAFAPRFAIVATPAAHSTVKLLYGEAYRAPSVAEGDLNADLYQPNPSLRAERIATWELAIEHRVASPLLIGASAYHYAMRGLIEQLTADTLNGFQYTNSQSTRGRGLELMMNLQPAESHFALRGWYARQQTLDASTNLQLTNSPQQTINFAGTVKGTFNTRAALTLRHETGRRTLNGSTTDAFTRADLNLGYSVPTDVTPYWLRGTDVSLRMSNLLNTRYSVPGGLEHTQQSIQQDGRMFSLRLRREF